MSDESKATRGILLPGLTILFVGLKLTNYIDWSWWWVLSPLWLPFAVVATGGVAVLASLGLFWLLCEVLQAVERRVKVSKRRR